MKYVSTYVIALFIFLLIDAIWLKSMTATFYRPALGHLMADKPNLLAAAGFYLFYILALCILVIFPQLSATETKSLLTVFFLGSVLGAAAYGTYDFTGLAVYKDFPAKVAIIDTLWGALLTGTVACATTAIIRKIL